MSNFKCISPQEAKDLIDTNNAIIVDIRNADVFRKGHVPHAHLISDDNVEAFVVEQDKSKALICYCYHGFSSRNAAAFFASQGFKDVYSVDGGYEELRKIYDLN